MTLAKSPIFNFKFLVVFCVFIFEFVACLAQEQSKDNLAFLAKDTFEELTNAYETSESVEMAISFAKAFLLKAKNQKDSLKMAEGYFKVGEVLKKRKSYNKSILYLDSTILIIKERQTNKLSAEAYILRGQINGSLTNFIKAMDDMGKANKHAVLSKNIAQQYRIKYYIAALKNNVGAPEESLSLFKEVVDYYNQNYLESKTSKKFHIQSLYGLGYQFNVLERPDSSKFYTKKAMELSLQTKEKYLYDRMLLSFGISHYLKKEYNAALDSILKVRKERESNPSKRSTIAADFFLGKIYNDLNQPEKAIYYFKKVDSLVFATDYFFNGLRQNYEFLIAHFRKEGSIKEQLFYINRLLKVDSILDRDFAHLSKEINSNYDTPNLLQKKEELIGELEKKNSRGVYILSALIAVTLVLIWLLLWYYRKQRIYKNRFQKLLEKTAEAKDKQSKVEHKSPSNMGISKEVVASVLQKLEAFEQEHGYLKLNLTLGELAKEFDTNSKYFSKIINVYKHKSFTNYINDLRINHVINELQAKPKLRKYTIKAIGNEAGFNTTEAFSKSFFKSTGIYPSFFIKQIEKQYLTK